MAKPTQFKAGDRVWYRPRMIGYGYAYGVDYGIPAVVDGLTPKRVRIVFAMKDGATVVTAARAISLEPRK